MMQHQRVLEWEVGSFDLRSVSLVPHYATPLCQSPGWLLLKHWNVSDYNININMNGYSPFLSFPDFLAASFKPQMIDLCFLLDEPGLRETRIPGRLGDLESEEYYLFLYLFYFSHLCLRITSITLAALIIFKNTIQSTKQ